MALQTPEPTWLDPHVPAGSFPLDQEALRIYQAAYELGIQTDARQGESPPVTFSSVMAALLTGGDETSRWFAALAKSLGPDAAKVFEGKGIKPAAIAMLSASAERVAMTGPPSGPVVTSKKDNQLLTISSRTVFKNAEAWAQKVGGTEIGVRHLLAAYLINPPPNHRKQMNQWGVDEARWREPFFKWVAPRYTSEQWTDVRSRAAPTRGLDAFEQPVSAESLGEWPGDATVKRILERAALVHAKRSDTWLRLGTLFQAFVEIARNEEQNNADLAPLRDAVKKVEAGYQSWIGRRAEDPVDKDRPLRPFRELTISPRVLNALETARELAVTLARGRNGAGHGVEVQVRHLAAALVSRRVDADDHLTAIGLNPADLQAAFLAAVRPGESSDVWREVLGEEETPMLGRPPRLNSDEPEAIVRADAKWLSDPLQIRGDVESFGSLLASRNLEPPLSVGLFGPWGAGKTTFLKRLRQAVDRRTKETEEARKTNGVTPYVENVVHVEFNAWHYAEQALTSSLVDAIFRTTSDFIKEKSPAHGQAWLDQRRQELQSVKRKADAAAAMQAAADGVVQKAEHNLVETREEVVRQTTAVTTVAKVTWQLAKAALAGNDTVKDSGVLDALGDVAGSETDLRNRLSEIRNRPGRLLGDLGWRRSVLFGALVLGLPPLVALAVNWFFGLGGVSQTVSSLAAMLSVVGVWAKTAKGAVAKVDSALAKIADTYEEKLAASDDLKTARTALEAARANAEAASARVAAAHGELARAQADLANAALPAQFLALLDGRISDETYKKELTSLSAARADLEALSRLMRAHHNGGGADTRPAGTGAAPPAEPGVNVKSVDRVILYIDDLDRCRPENVVRVLQLVHMLLAFELFVVVVAVDSRWVHHSLAEVYPWLGGNDDVTAVKTQDYLEKIFQIAFWLEPMSSARAASYLASLVRSPTALKVAAGGSTEITTVELDYLKALAAHVGPSPRRVKRLINSYRLLKARMSEAQLSQFVTSEASNSSGPQHAAYQLAIGLLVISTGAADSASEILSEIANCDPKDTFAELSKRLRTRPHADWNMAAHVLDTLGRSGQGVAELRGWAQKVARLLLQGPPEQTSQVRKAQQHQNGTPHTRAREFANYLDNDGGATT